jgi:hypothetical protein
MQVSVLYVLPSRAYSGTLYPYCMLLHKCESLDTVIVIYSYSMRHTGPKITQVRWHFDNDLFASRLCIITSGTSHTSINISHCLKKTLSRDLRCFLFSHKVIMWPSKLTMGKTMTQLTVTTHILYEFVTFVIHFVWLWCKSFNRKM